APERRDHAAQWAAQFQAPPGAKIAFDDRTSQLLVMGSSSLHDFVAGQLNAVALPTGTNPAPTAAAPTPRMLPQDNAASGTPPSGVRLTLATSNGRDLHHRLEKLLSRPLPATTTSDGRAIAFRAEMVPGSGVWIEAALDSGELRLT